MLTKTWQEPWYIPKNCERIYISTTFRFRLSVKNISTVCEVKYILLRVLTKADCSGHIIKFQTTKILGSSFLITNVVLQYLHFSALARPFSGRESHVSDQTKIPIFSPYLFTSKFLQKEIRYNEIVFKNRFLAIWWFAIIFFKYWFWLQKCKEHFPFTSFANFPHLLSWNKWKDI